MDTRELWNQIYKNYRNRVDRSQLLEIFIKERRPMSCYDIGYENFLISICHFCLIDSIVKPPFFYCTLIDANLDNNQPVCEDWHINKALLEIL